MENLDPNVIFLWRAIERLINVLIGALSIYLGYRLFTNLPEKRQDENGKLKLLLPGDISVYVSRVGPGIFFALFGSAIVLTSMVSTLDLSVKNNSHSKAAVNLSLKEPGHTGPLNELASSEISYVSDVVDVATLSTERASVKRDLLSLRKLEQALNFYLEDPQNNTPTLTVNDASSLLNTLMRVKRTMLLSVWDRHWGDPEQFAQWVQEGAMEPAPEGLTLSARLFLGND